MHFKIWKVDKQFMLLENNGHGLKWNYLFGCGKKASWVECIARCK